MRLNTAQQERIRQQHGLCVNECCDSCRKLLGAIRYTRRDTPGEWCSYECRDGQAAAEARRLRPARNRRAAPPQARKQGQQLQLEAA